MQPKSRDNFPLAPFPLSVPGRTLAALKAAHRHGAETPPTKVNQKQLTNMELLQKLQGHNAGQSYVIRMFYDDSEKVYIIRYTWIRISRKYTRSKKIQDSDAANFYFSYSAHMCRRHIGLETSPLDSLLQAQSLPSENMPTPRTAVRNCSNVQPSTPAQRNPQRNIILKLIYNRPL